MTTNNTQLTNQWKESFLTKDAVTQLLSEAGLIGHEFKGIFRTYTIDSDRLAVLVDTVKTEGGHLGRILIDVKDGNPIYEQIMEDVYSLGAKCDAIIMVSMFGSQEKLDDSVDEDQWIAETFTTFLNDHGVTTYLLGAALEPDTDEHQITYRVIGGPVTEGNASPANLPPRKELEENALYTVYEQTPCLDDPPLYAQPDCWPVTEMEYYCEERLSITPFWNENGFYARITRAPLDKEPKNIMGLIWRKCQQELREKFKESDLSVENTRKQGMALTIRISEKTLRDFMLSMPNEKQELAVTLHNGVRDIHDFFLEIMEGMGLLES